MYFIGGPNGRRRRASQNTLQRFWSDKLVLYKQSELHVSLTFQFTSRYVTLPHHTILQYTTSDHTKHHHTTLHRTKPHQTTLHLFSLYCLSRNSYVYIFLQTNAMRVVVATLRDIQEIDISNVLSSRSYYVDEDKGEMEKRQGYVAYIAFISVILQSHKLFYRKAVGVLLLWRPKDAYTKG